MLTGLTGSDHEYFVPCMIARMSYIIVGYFTHVLLGNFGQVFCPAPPIQLFKVRPRLPKLGLDKESKLGKGCDTVASK
jgi:hypothetical protein